MRTIACPNYGLDISTSPKNIFERIQRTFFSFYTTNPYYLSYIGLPDNPKNEKPPKEKPLSDKKKAKKLEKEYLEKKEKKAKKKSDKEKKIKIDIPENSYPQIVNGDQIIKNLEVLRQKEIDKNLDKFKANQILKSTHIDLKKLNDTKVVSKDKKILFLGIYTVDPNEYIREYGSDGYHSKSNSPEASVKSDETYKSSRKIKNTATNKFNTVSKSTPDKFKTRSKSNASYNSSKTENAYTSNRSLKAKKKISFSAFNLNDENVFTNSSEEELTIMSPKKAEKFMVRPHTPMYTNQSTKELDKKMSIGSKRTNFVVDSSTDEDLEVSSLSTKKTKPFMVRGPTPMYPNQNSVSSFSSALDNLIDQIVDASKKSRSVTLPFQPKKPQSRLEKALNTKSDSGFTTELDSSLEILNNANEKNRIFEKSGSNNELQRILSQLNLHLKLKNEKIIS